MVERRRYSTGRRQGTTGQRRRPARGGLPPWVVIVMIAGPLVAILAALALRVQRANQGQENESPQEVVDPNQELNDLAKQVESIRRDVREVMRLSRSDSTEEVQAKAAKVKRRIDQWIKNWDKHLNPLRDKDGRLPPDYQYYSQVRADVNLLRVDLLKVGSF